MEMIGNIGVGEEIHDVREFLRLALAKESIVCEMRTDKGPRYKMVKSATFFLAWRLDMILRNAFYYAVKV